MNEQNPININLIPDLPESTKEEAFNPSANLIGQALRGIAHKVLDPLVRYNIVKDQEMSNFAEKIRNKTSTIPIENRDTKKIGLTLKAVEDATYQLNSEELREMFANLIASTVDNRRNNEVHPSFSSILKDFSPKDAILFKLLCEDDAIPLITLRIEESKTNTGINIKENIILLNDENVVEPVVLNNLVRFGLIEISANSTLKASKYIDRYSKFKETKYFKDQESELPIVTEEFTFDKLVANEGRLDVTALGKRFSNVVIFPQ